MIEIFGCIGKISDLEDFLRKIRDFEREKNVKIQCFNSDMIYGKKHLISASEKAIRSFENKSNSTDSIQMEILLYASGEKQLKHAIPKMGIKKGNSNITILIIYEKNKDIKIIVKEIIDYLNLKRNDDLLNGDIDVLKRFGFKKSEIETVSKNKYEDLILEKVAMVDIIK